MIFGFAQTNLGLVLRRCRDEVGGSNVQIITARDQVMRRQCYVVLGVRALDIARRKALRKSGGVVVVVDALPSLLRVEGIRILDADEKSMYWNRQHQPKFAPLIRALQSDPRHSKIVVYADDTLSQMVTRVRTRSVLDKVLSAAKTMEPTDRTRLHADVAHVMYGQLSMRALRRRAESRGASGKHYDAMLDALSSDTAHRLSSAIKDHMSGVDAVSAAAAHDVEASEIRFLSAHLR